MNRTQGSLYEVLITYISVLWVQMLVLIVYLSIPLRPLICNMLNGARYLMSRGGRTQHPYSVIYIQGQ
jgi:hypothetical protein